MHSKRTIFNLMVFNLRQIIPHSTDKLLGYHSDLNSLGAFSVVSDMIEETIEALDLKADRFEFHSATNLGELADLFLQKIKRDRVA